MNPVRACWRLIAFPMLFGATLAWGGQVSYVVHISVDGLPSWFVQGSLAAAPSQFPALLRLRSEAAFTYNARSDYDYTETIPNHTCMFTGRPVLQPPGFPNTTHHGYINNFPDTSPTSPETYHNSGNLNVPYKASFFDVVHDHGLTAAFYASKSKLTICDRSYNAISGALDLIPPDNGRDKIDFSFINEGSVGDNGVIALFDNLVQNLASAAPRNYSFLHSSEPDKTGHIYQWGSAQYSNAVRMVDSQIVRVLNAINSSQILSNHTVLIVTTDHGGGGIDAGGICCADNHVDRSLLKNYTIPFFLWGPGIPAGADLYGLFSNRGDPGTNRVDYTVVPQPLRAGDSGNLALSLLGLPPIPGSLMIPTFTGPRLTITRGANGYTVSWSSSFSNFILEQASTLPTTQWNRITTGITDNGTTRTYNITDTPEPQFYRLEQQ